MREEENTTQSCNRTLLFSRAALDQFWQDNAWVYFIVSVSEVMQDVAQGLEEEWGGEQEEGEQHLGRGEGRRLHLLLPFLSSLHLTVVIWFIDNSTISLPSLMYIRPFVILQILSCMFL